MFHPFVSIPRIDMHCEHTSLSTSCCSPPQTQGTLLSCFVLLVYTGYPVTTCFSPLDQSFLSSFFSTSLPFQSHESAPASCTGSMPIAKYTQNAVAACLRHCAQWQFMKTSWSPLISRLKLCAPHLQLHCSVRLVILFRTLFQFVNIVSSSPRCPGNRLRNMGLQMQIQTCIE